MTVKQVFPPLTGKDTTAADCERRLEELREYVRQHPDMQGYIEPQREAIRRQLRGIRRQENVKPVIDDRHGISGFWVVIGGLLIIAGFLLFIR